MMVVRSIRWLATVVVFGCSSEVHVGAPGEGGGGGLVPSLPEGFATPPGCSAPRLVPEGATWLGNVLLADESARFETTKCPAGAPSIGWQRFVVPAVFLDAREVSRACFDACVEAGACAPPEIDVAWNESVLVFTAAAEAFCEWRGGRLPTLAEMARAAKGSHKSLMAESAVDALTMCAPSWVANDGDQACKALLLHAEGGLSFSERWSGDLGPFGHRDLFGGSAERTSSAVYSNGAFCESPSDTIDPGSFDDQPTTPKSLYVGGAKAADALAAPSVPTLVESWAWPTEGEPYGFRCAYDPVFSEP